MEEIKARNSLDLTCYNKIFGRIQYIRYFRALVKKYHKNNLAIWIVMLEFYVMCPKNSIIFHPGEILEMWPSFKYKDDHHSIVYKK